MGRRIAKKPAPSKKTDPKKPAKSTGIPKYAYLGKSALAAYPDEEGNALWLGMKDSVAEVLSAESLVEKASNKNTEMLARPGLALSLAAAATHHGGRAVMKGSAQKALGTLAVLLKTPEGQAFLQASKALNLGKEGTPARAVVRKAVREHVKYFQAAGPDLQDALVGVAASCAKVYLMAMHCLEQKALLGKPTAFAKKWRRGGSHPKELKQWLKDPSDKDALSEALVDMVMAKIAAHKKAAKAGSSSTGTASGSTAEGKTSTDSSSEAVARKTKKAKKPRIAKDKKHRKSKRKEASLSGSSDPEPKKAKKRASSSPSFREPTLTAGQPPLEISSGDAESSEQEDPSALLQWDAKEAAQLAQEVAEALEHLSDKKKRHSHSALVAMLDNIPEAVLAEAGLKEAAAGLKKLQKLPKQSKVRALLSQLQELAARRARAEGPEMKTKAEKHQGSEGDDAAEGTVRVTIHRIGSTTNQGRTAVVREGDPVDCVDVLPAATVEEALTHFFAAQGSSEDRANWDVKQLSGDHTLQPVDPDTAQACSCRDIALIRKGG